MDTREVDSALSALSLTRSQLDNLHRRQVELVSFLRDSGRLEGWEPVSWDVIARALGVSRQAAWSRFSWIDDGVNDD